MLSSINFSVEAFKYVDTMITNFTPNRYKLRPIVTLFTPEVMSIDRIATRDGKPILVSIKTIYL